MVQESAHEEANIIFGLVTDPNMEDVVKVTVIATGFDAPASEPALTQPAYHHSATHYPAQSIHAQVSRGVSAQSMPRNSIPTGAGHNPRSAVTVASQPRPTLSRPARGVESSGHHPHHAHPSQHAQHAPQGNPSEAQPARAFGAAAMLDEAVLDIPAYLRRSRG